jgi:hypothetical protein
MQPIEEHDPGADPGAGLRAVVDQIMGVRVHKAAADFENAMAKLWALTGADRNELEELRSAVLHMAQAGAMSPTQVAEQLAAVLPDPEPDEDVPPITIPHQPGRSDTRIRRGFPRVQVQEFRMGGETWYRLATTRNGREIEQWTPSVREKP